MKSDCKKIKVKLCETFIITIMSQITIFKIKFKEIDMN